MSEDPKYVSRWRQYYADRAWKLLAGAVYLTLFAAFVLSFAVLVR